MSQGSRTPYQPLPLLPGNLLGWDRDEKGAKGRASRLPALGPLAGCFTLVCPAAGLCLLTCKPWHTLPPSLLNLCSVPETDGPSHPRSDYRRDEKEREEPNQVEIYPFRKHRAKYKRHLSRRWRGSRNCILLWRIRIRAEEQSTIVAGLTQMIEQDWELRLRRTK